MERRELEYVICTTIYTGNLIEYMLRKHEWRQSVDKFVDKIMTVKDDAECIREYTGLGIEKSARLKQTIISEVV